MDAIFSNVWVSIKTPLQKLPSSAFGYVYPQPDDCLQIGMIIRVAGDWEIHSPGIQETGFDQLEIWATADDTRRIPLFKRFWQHWRRLEPP